MTAPPSTSRTPRTTRSAASPKLCRSERKDSRTVTQPRCKNSLKIMLSVSEIYVVCGLVVRKASEPFLPLFLALLDRLFAALFGASSSSSSNYHPLALIQWHANQNSTASSSAFILRQRASACLTPLNALNRNAFFCSSYS